MESAKDSAAWKKGEPVTLRKLCRFIRKGALLELDPGNILIPLEDPGKRSLKVTDAGKVYVWSFLLPDGSITEFYLHTISYKHAKNLDAAMSKDMKDFFQREKKKSNKKK